MARKLLSWRMERISGPFMGHYVAAYVLPVEGGYVGYAKICASPPGDVWQCDAMDKVASQPRASDAQALAAAETKARMFLDLMHDYHGIDPVTPLCAPVPPGSRPLAPAGA